MKGVRHLGLVIVVGFLAAAVLEPAVAHSQEPKKSSWTYNADLLRPFWEGEVIHGESVLFIRDSKTGVAKASVLFPVEKILHVRNSAGDTRYEEGRDFVWQPQSREIVLLAGSRIVSSRPGDLRRPAKSQKFELTHRDGDGEIFFGARLEYAEMQTCITYAHAPNLWKSALPKFDPSALPRSVQKLLNRQPLSIVLLGDSISAGANASGLFDAAPFQPAYPELLQRYLAARFQGRVEMKNLSVGGKDTAWGLTQVDNVVEARPDLVILAFGMNDSAGRTAKDFEANTKSTIARIREKLPDAEFILVATMLGNRDWIRLKHEVFPQYRDALASLCEPGIALADLTSIWTEFLKLKQDWDQTGNGVNHPNDFGHRVYAQVLATLLDPQADRAAGAAGVPPIPATERTVVIERCSLFDPESGKMLPEQTIVIRGTQIVRVAGADDVGELPVDATRIDGRGKFALPGLIDAHVHVVHVLDYAHVTGDEVLPLYLAAGVTSIRSTGDEVVAATLVARLAAAHPERSPRVFTCSPLLDADPPIHRDVGQAVTDPAKVAAVFDDLAQWNITTVKIYAGTARPVGKAIIDECHRRGLFVTAHLGRYSAQDAVADGIDGLEHIWSVFNYVIPPEVATQPGHRGMLDLGNPLCESLVAELARRKIFVDPTLAVFRNMLLLPDVPEVRDHPDNALVPRRLREFWPVYLKRSGCPQGGPLDDRRREFAKFQELTGKLYRAGVPLLAGTDAPEPQVPPGFSLHQELEMLVESGMPPAAALRAATLTNATVLGEKDHLGSISAGKTGDIALLSANPLDDIRNTRRIELVIHMGQVCRPDDLLKLVPRE